MPIFLKELVNKDRFIGLFIRKSNELVEFYVVKNKKLLCNWGNRTFWAAADQGIFAGTNFLLNILLARWLPSNQYGAFVLSYSIFLVFGVIHNSLITEPMLVLGSGKYSKYFQSYFRILRKLHWKLASIFCIVLLFTTLILWVVGGSELFRSFLGLCISAPFILYLWFFRRIFYIMMSPKYSACSSLIYGVLNLSLLFLLNKYWHITPFTAFLTIGLSSLIITFSLTRTIGSISIEQENTSWANIVVDHWQYGRWILPSALLAWIPSNIIYFLLSSFGELADGASLRALMNLQMPVLHINTALGVLFIPYLSKFIQSQDYHKFYQLIKSTVILYSVLTGLYVFLLFLFNDFIFTLLYRGKFSEFAYLVPVLSLFLLFAAISAAMGNAIRVLQATNKILVASVVTAMISVSIGIWLVPRIGVQGAVITLIFSSCCEACFLTLAYRQTVAEKLK